MKLLYIGDIHERLNPPKNRIDEYQNTLDEKAKEIWKIANKNNVTAILQGGDFNDTPKVPDDYQAKLIKRWSSTDVYDIVKKIATNEVSNADILKELKKGKPIIGVVGNHDQFGGSMQGFNKTSLSFLSEVGLINLVTKKKPIILKDENEDFSVAITGANYDVNIDKDPKHKSYIIDKKNADYHIHLVHGMLANQDFGGLFPHTRIEDIEKTEADLTISGHDHIGFDPVEIDGKLFVNPGAIIRLSNSEREMNRIPKVMIIEITKEHGIELTMIPLKSAKPADEVLSVEKKEYKKQMDVRIKKIKETIDDVINDDTKSIIDIVEDIPLSESVQQKTKDDIKEKILLKMGNEQTNTFTQKEPYYITKLILENFQTHENTTLEFDKSLNVIVGKSDDGKSAIIRGFQFIFGELTNSAKAYIRHGEKFAKASIYLSDGTIIIREVEKKVNGFNGYHVFTTEENKWMDSNTKNLPVIHSLLGYSEMVLDEKNHFSINFLEQDDSHFFIGKNTTPAMRAKIIGTVYKTHYGDSVLRDLETEFKKNNAQLVAKEKDVNGYEDKLACMVHITPLENKINEVKEKIHTVDDMQEKLNELKKLSESVISLNKKIKSFDDFIEQGNIFIKSKSEIISLISLEQQKDNISLVYNSMKNLSKNILYLKSYIEGTQLLLKHKERINEIELNCKTVIDANNSLNKMHDYRIKITHLKKYKENVHGMVNNINAIDSLIQHIQLFETINLTGKESVILIRKGKALSRMINKVKPVVAGLKERIPAILNQTNDLSEIENIFSVYKGLGKSARDENGKVLALTKERELARTDYKTYLKDIKVCPVCLHELNETSINNMLEN